MVNHENEDKFITPFRANVVVFENPSPRSERAGIMGYVYEPTKGDWISKEIDGVVWYFDGNGVCVAGIDSKRILGVDFE